MPDTRCGGGVVYSRDPAGSRYEEDNDCEFEESDPSGRYVRYKEILGRGAFKTVYKAFDEVEGIEVAWNQIKVKDVLHTPEDLERLYSEVHLLRSLKHKNIIKYHHSWVDSRTKNLNFITEIFTSGTLRQYRKRHKRVDIKAVKNWSRQILRGLLYLHSHDPPIIHRDLKCDNIFINGNQGEVKIGDLGLAAILRQANAAHSVIGTPEFMAPELYEENYTELVDIYSFGMCLLEMVTSEYPYSECINAAQIYKKVSSGKKPAALSKVKDPDLRFFVDKCLATASRRLPARELLMDDFLRCDANRDSMESLHVLGSAATNTDDMDDLVAVLGKAFYRPSFFGRSLKDVESFSKLPEIDQAKLLPAVANVISRSVDEESFTKNHGQVVSYSQQKEDRSGRNIDFTVKGKRRENDTVYLRLRIADPEGQVRVIHFPFDVEGDTAMCVASEMVTELDLTDQDVTKIAELIDAAILAMVPEWRPGVAWAEGEDYLSKTPVQSNLASRMVQTSDHASTLSSETSLLDQSQHGSSVCQDSFEKTAGVSTLSPQTEYATHGRFEEVTYHQTRSEHELCEGEGQCTFSSYSSEELVDWEPTDESSSPVSPISDPLAPKDGPDTLYRPSVTALGGVACATVETVESMDDHSVAGGNSKNSEILQEHLSKNSHGIFSVLEIPATCDDRGKRELEMKELKEVNLKYEQELTELQRKHKEALAELRYRWNNKAVFPKGAEM